MQWLVWLSCSGGFGFAITSSMKWFGKCINETRVKKYYQKQRLKIEKENWAHLAEIEYFVEFQYEK